MCKKMIFKHSSASSTLVTLPFYKRGGHRLLWNVAHCCAVLWGASGMLIHSSWQLLLFSQPWLLVPHFLSLSKSCSNLTGVLIQEQQTQRGLLDSGSHFTASPATKYLLQRAVPVIPHVSVLPPSFKSLQNIFYNIHQFNREILGGLLNF